MRLPLVGKVSGSSLANKGIAIMAIALTVAAWYLLTTGSSPEYRVISPVLLPSPGEVLAAFRPLAETGGLVVSFASTMRRVFLGFGLAVAVGVPLGIMAGVSSRFRALSEPFIIFLRNVPVAVLIPLTILWFGIDERQKIMFIFIATVAFIFTASVAAVAAVPERFVDTALTLGASRWQVVSKVKVPMALPDIYIACRGLFGMALGYIMLAELINAKNGLGFIINTGQRLGDRPTIFAILVVIAFTAWFFDKILLLFQKGFFPFRSNQE